MKQIHSACLVNFYSNCKEHMDIRQKFEDYHFYRNLYLIKDFLEQTDFPDGVDIDENDYKRFIVEDNFLIGIDLINDELDEYKYLFDAFNVYFCQEGSLHYTQDPTLTTAWRKVMAKTYVDSNYVNEVKKLLQKEMQQEINEIIEDYNNQQNDLLQI